VDEAAFQAVVTAQALPRATESDKALRTSALQAALIGAAEAPLEAARLASDAFALTASTAELHNANLMSDVDCAMHFARAAFDASAVNVEVNHRYITDPGTVTQQRDRLATLARAAREFESRTTTIIVGRRN
jgi:formiminotetrahydrofolate cyclodeaminase